MSSVDNRIVEMQFNNRRFEENARETMSTLDKLKEKLNFKSSTKDLEEFQNAANTFNLSHISSAVDEIGNKFSLMGQLGFQAMQRIASAALDAGTALVKSISIDQISAGMQKYEQETNVIQTLYGALKPKGTKLEEIYDVMETLTAYSDETSYSYTQMADAVSKFVNAGVDLHKAETVIEGISNAAALAGIGIHDTAIIYRNFADAIGKGGFRQQDWKSIKIAHMDTEWLKQAFIDEAIAQGKLDKTGRVLVKAEKKNKKGEVTQAAEYKNVRDDFEGTLIKGWLDNDVINGVMLKYATRDLEGFGKEAFAAAQNAKTFTDVLDAVKDAASTGWSRTFRIIFGDLEEAINFFTPMANKIIEVVNAIDEARNTIFGKWKELGGRDSMIATLDNVWRSLMKIGDQLSGGLISTLRKTFYPSWEDLEKSATSGGIWDLMGEQLADFTKNLEKATESFNKWLNGRNNGEGPTRFTQILEIFKGIFSVLSMISKVISGVSTFIGEIFDQLQPTFDAILTLFADLGWDLSELNRDLSRDKGITIFAKNLAAIFTPLTKRLPKIVNWIGDLYKRFKKFWTTNRGFVAFRKSVENAFNAFIGFVPKAVESAIQWGKSVIDMVKSSDEWKTLVNNYNKYIKPLLSVLRGGATQFNNALADFFNMDTSDEETLWGKIKKRFSAFDKLGPWLKQTWDGLKKQFPWLQNVQDWWDESPVVAAVKEWVGKIGDAIDAFMSVDTSDKTSIVGKIKARFEAMWNVLGPWLKEKWESFKTEYPILQQIEDFITNLFGWGKPAEEAAQDADEQTNGIVKFLQGIWDKISEFAQNVSFGDFLKFVGAIATLVEGYKIARNLAGWTTLSEQLQEIVESVGNFITQSYKKLKAETLKTKAETLLAISASIWLMVDNLDKLSKLSFEQIATGLGGMALIFGEEAGFLKILDIINGNTKTDAGTTFSKLADGVTNIGLLLTIGANMIEMAGALKILGSQTWEEIGKGLTEMAGIFISEGLFMKFLSGLGGDKTVGGIFANITSGVTNIGHLVTITANLITVGGTLMALGTQTWEAIGKGLAAMAGIFIEEGLFMSFLSGLSGNTTIGGIFANLANGVSNSATLITIGANMLEMAGALIWMGSQSWEAVAKGLVEMAGIFVGEGLFMKVLAGLAGDTSIGGIFSNLVNGIANSGYLISIGLNMLEMASALNTLGSMTWEELGKSLNAMASIFIGEGLFMEFLSGLGGAGEKASKLANLSVAIGQSAMLISIGENLKSAATFLETIGKMTWDEIGKGLGAMAGLYVGEGAFALLISKIAGGWDVGAISAGIGGLAAGTAKLAEQVKPLGEMTWEKMLQGLIGIIVIAGVLYEFTNSVNGIKPVAITKILSVFTSAIVLAGLMVAFGFALSMTKDVDPWSIVAFAAGMVAIATAMSILAGALNLLVALDLGTAVKGASILVIAAAAAAVATALILEITGSAIADFSDNIAIVGANLAAYADQVKDIDYDKVGGSVNMIKDLSAALVEVGGKNYGAIETFRTNFVRIGSGLKLFNNNAVAINVDQMKAVTEALKDMSSDLAGLTAVTDVSTTIGNIGGAIKMYGDSLNGVTLDKAPDATAIKQVFDALKGALPNDEDMTEVAGYAAEGKGDEMTNFAIGLTNIATAVSTFSESAKDLNFDNIQKATDALSAIASLDTGLSITTIVHFGPFGLELNAQQAGLTNFATDIVTLGDALNSFATSISTVNKNDLTTGANVLKRITKINNALPKEGGLSQILTGTQSLTRFAANLRNLGGGAKAFGEAVSGSSFDASSVSAAGDALIKIAEINGKLPKTGGISSWFTGDESLTGFSTGLSELGKGVAAFATSFGETKITGEMLEATNFLNRIASIQVKLSTKESWYNMATLGSELNNAATAFSSANSTLKNIEWVDTTPFEHLLSFVVEQQVALGSTTYTKNIGQIGTDIKNFFNEVWSFTNEFLGTNTGKIDLVTDSLVSIFSTINTTFAYLSEEDGPIKLSGQTIVSAMVNGIGSDESKLKVTNAIKDIGAEIIRTVYSYRESFKAVGTWIPAGLGEGIWNNRYAAINAAIDVMNAAIEAAETTAGVASPSKEFARIGMYSDMGLAQGFSDFVYLVDSAASDVSQSALNTMLNDLGSIQDLPLDQLEINPTIRPVLDTSDISSRAGTIDGLLGGTRTIGFNTRQLEAQAQLLGESTGSDIGMINQQILGLRDQLAQLEETISNLKMVVDTGALVGAMRSDIDKAMGAMARLGERGN